VVFEPPFGARQRGYVLKGGECRQAESALDRHLVHSLSNDLFHPTDRWRFGDEFQHAEESYLVCGAGAWHHRADRFALYHSRTDRPGPLDRHRRPGPHACGHNIGGSITDEAVTVVPISGPAVIAWQDVGAVISTSGSLCGAVSRLS